MIICINYFNGFVQQQKMCNNNNKTPVVKHYSSLYENDIINIKWFMFLRLKWHLIIDYILTNAMQSYGFYIQIKKKMDQ